MDEQPKSRNRLHGLYRLYRDNAAGLSTEYALLRQRLLDLNLASVRNARAIDDLLHRLQVAPHPALGR